MVDDAGSVCAPRPESATLALLAPTPQSLAVSQGAEHRPSGKGILTGKQPKGPADSRCYGATGETPTYCRNLSGTATTFLFAVSCAGREGVWGLSTSVL
jgi:hypothetical protein